MSAAAGMAATTAGHNSAARAVVIRDIVAKLDDVNIRIAELQEERKRVKGRIKADLGMKVADFNVLHRFYGLEDDPRDVLFDTLREGFAALGIGVQSTFLDAIDAPKVAPLTEEAAGELGDKACEAGRAEDDFDKGVRSKKQKQAWLRGYALAKARQVRVEQESSNGAFADKDVDVGDDDAASEPGDFAATA